MGRFGLTSLGHGAFTGIGAYVTVLLWNFAGLTPLLGIPIAVLLATMRRLAGRISLLPLRITGHYFALLTLAFTEFVRLCIVGLRDYTGGSLGTQPKRYGDGLSLYALQFEPDRMLAYYIVLAIWIVGSTSGCGSTAAWTASRSTPPPRTRTPPPPSAST